jgi:hypothetical protein
MNYLDTIQKFISGSDYAGDTIQTSDGRLAYVTKTGVAKQYTSMNVYNATANKHGCTSTPVQLEPKWSDLGFPIGSIMKTGQSCGNEGKYVQSAPPTNDFDASFYIQNNADLKDFSPQQAANHWNTYGVKEGRLPNNDILTSMSNLGKVGYVDLNTNLHSVPVSYTGKYTSYSAPANVTGANMEDCTPEVKYGEQVFMLSNKRFGRMNNASMLEFGSSKTTLYLRPSIGRWMPGYPVKYGDKVSITSTSDNWFTQCGWWGCKVGRVNPQTLLFEFGPGGNLGGTTFVVTPPPGSAYQEGSILKYGFPFTLVASIVLAGDTLRQDQSLYPGQSLMSSNGEYRLTYQTDGNVCIYRIDGSSVWCSRKTHNPGRLTMQSDGNLVAYNKRGIPKFAINSGGGRNRPYRFTIQTNGEAVVYDNKRAIWGTGNARASSVETIPLSKIGYVRNNLLAFGSVNQSQNSSIFTFSPTDLKIQCKLNELQMKCNQRDCSGFIHSPNDNTWQPISSSSSPDDFKISAVRPNVYVKDAKVNMRDASCTQDKTYLIDPDQFQHYIRGNNFTVNGKNQCQAMDMKPIRQGQVKYDKENQKMMNRGNYIANQYRKNNAQVWRRKNNNVELNLDDKTDEYEKTESEIKTLINNNTGTYQQQKEDIEILNTQNRMHAIAWSLLAIITVSVVISRSK